MLADKQRQLLHVDLKLFTNSHLLWRNTQLLKMPRVSKNWYPIKKANTQFWIDYNSLGIYPIDLKAYLFFWHVKV